MTQQQTCKTDHTDYVDDELHDEKLLNEGHSAYESRRGDLPLGRRAQRVTRFPLGPETTLEKSSTRNVIVKRNVDHDTDTGASASRPYVILPSDLAGASFTFGAQRGAASRSQQRRERGEVDTSVRNELRRVSAESEVILSEKLRQVCDQIKAVSESQLSRAKRRSDDIVDRSENDRDAEQRSVRSYEHEASCGDEVRTEEASCGDDSRTVMKSRGSIDRAMGETSPKHRVPICLTSGQLITTLNNTQFKSKTTPESCSGSDKEPSRRRMIALSATYRAIESELAEVRRNEAGKHRSRREQPSDLREVAALSSSETIGSEPAKRNQEPEKNGQQRHVLATTDRHRITSDIDVAGKDCMWASDICDSQRTVTTRRARNRRHNDATENDSEVSSSSIVGVERLFQSDDASKPVRQFDESAVRNEIRASNIVERPRVDERAFGGERRHGTETPERYCRVDSGVRPSSVNEVMLMRGEHGNHAETIIYRAGLMQRPASVMETRRAVS
jgi:hypothetical protein